MQDIHDIRPPVAVGLDPAMLKMVMIILTCLFLAWLLFFLIRTWWKKRKGATPVEAIPEPLSPFDEAAESLETISKRSMDDPRLFYYDLTFVLRRYMGRSFDISAVEMTSEEFIREVGRLNLDKEVRKEISLFQSLSDPFKYAGLSAETGRVKKDIDLVRQVILKIEKNLAGQRQEKKEES